MIEIKLIFFYHEIYNKNFNTFAMLKKLCCEITM